MFLEIFLSNRNTFFLFSEVSFECQINGEKKFKRHLINPEKIAMSLGIQETNKVLTCINYKEENVNISI